MSTSSEGVSRDESYQQCLSVVIASLCLEANYESVDEAVMKALVEILQFYFSKIGKTVRLFCEHSGRTLPNSRDVMCALADMGFSSHALPGYLRRTQRVNARPISKTDEAINAPVLQVGKRKIFPNYVPEHYNFPPFPDPHSYVRTTTGQKASTDYADLRERLSEQRRDVERALTRFVAKTGKSHPLLQHDKNAFPLIEAQPTGLPYLAALLPSEHEIGILKKENETEEDKDGKKSGVNNSSTGEHLGKRRNDDAETVPSSAIRNNPFLRPVKKLKTKRS